MTVMTSDPLLPPSCSPCSVMSRPPSRVYEDDELTPFVESELVPFVLDARNSGRSRPGAFALIRTDGRMPTIDVPWGPDGSLGLSLPTSGPFSEAEIDVAWPDTSGPLVDYESALEHALDHPVECFRLEDQVAPGSSVAIVVDDPSRWTPVREALPIILKRLSGAGVRSQDITISVGVGRHMPVDADAMRRRVGAEIAAEYRCFSPPVDDLSAYDDLGQTPQGIPVRVFRPVAQASLRILVGSVLPHLQAGFGGGYKLIFPGTSHRTTLGALHRQGIGGRSKPVGLLGESCGRQCHETGDSRRGSTLGAVLVGQPPCRRARAGFSDRRGAS